MSGEKIASDTVVEMPLRTIRRLLNAVNGVTAPHRHGNEISNRALDSLSNVQLDVEKELRK